MIPYINAFGVLFSPIGNGRVLIEYRYDHDTEESFILPDLKRYRKMDIFKLKEEYNGKTN